MPIAPIVLQRRLREIGRIRAGDQVEFKRNDGSKGTRPRKLAKFRMTCTDLAILEAAAADPAIGGKLRKWEGSPGDAEQWELYTDVSELEVFVPPGDTAFSQWLELWSAGGCQRRCDGQTEYTGKEPRPCLCDPLARDCEFHARLSLIIPSLPGLGVWRIETKSWYANQELAGAVEVCQALSSRGTLLPARLRLEAREVKRKDDKGKPVTYKFIVPVLDTPTSLPIAQLMTGGTSVGALAETAQREVGNGFRPVPLEALPAGPSTSIADQAAAVNDPAPARPRRNAQEPIPSTGMRPRPAAAVAEIEGAVAESTTEPPPAGDSGSDPAAPSDDDDTKRAQSVAMWCRDHGLETDDDRHHFLEAFSEGRYASAKKVPIEDLPHLRAALVGFRRGELELINGDGKVWVLVPSSAAEEPPPEEPAPTDGPWTMDRWLERIANVPGIGQVRLLNRARDLAAEIGVKAPGSLNELTDPKLVEKVQEWLGEQAAA